jgi:hypothetical protein
MGVMGWRIHAYVLMRNHYHLSRAWEDSVQSALHDAKRTDADLATTPLRPAWKLALAAEVRQQSGAPWAWLATRLQLGPAGTLRSQQCRQRKSALQHATA